MLPRYGRRALVLPPKRSRWPWLVLAVLAACAVLLATRMRVSTAITQFAVDQAGPDSRWIEELGTSEPARTMVFTVEHPDLAQALAVARELGERLAAHEEVAAVVDGPPADVAERLHALVFPRRWRFVDRDPERAAAKLSDDGLAAAAAHLRLELARPSGAAIKHIAAEDPLLLFPERMRELGAGQPGALQVMDGRFVTADGNAAVLLVTTRHGPFEGAHQLALHEEIEASVAELAAVRGATIERSALHRFAVTSERAIRRDVQLLSTISALGVMALLLLAYRSLRALLLAAAPIGAAMLVASTVTLLVYGRVHGLTLAFGSTLIGVCVDYPVHLFAHHFGADQELRARDEVVWTGLWLGAATTVVAFAALAAAGLPGVREIGVFASTGVLAALATTRLLVRPWLPPARSAASMPMAHAIDRALVRVAAQRRGFAIFAVVIAIIGITGLLRAQWVDDARALDSQLPAFFDEDQRVRARVEPIEVGRLLLSRGDSLEHALAVQDRLWTRLADDGLTASVRGSAALLRSRASQDASLAAVADSPDLAARLSAALAAAGFDPTRFADPQLAVRDDPGPLDLAALEAAGLAGVVRPFVIERDDGAAVVAFVRGEADTTALAEAAAQVPGASYFDQRRFVEQLARTHRQGTTFALALGLLAVIVLLALRYRRIDRVLTTLLPAALAAAAALGILAWAGVQLNLLHLVACLLVLGIGVDYGVFMAESADVPRARAPTVLGIAVACATTVWSFGVLGTSSSPAIGGLGLTVAIGVLLAALLAPLAALAIPRTRPEPP
jgi:predicted exporter